MSVENNGRWKRWLPWLGVGALLVYLVSPLLTQAPRAAGEDQEAAAGRREGAAS